MAAAVATAASADYQLDARQDQCKFTSISTFVEDF
jgi:hypothetical protein